MAEPACTLRWDSVPEAPGVDRMAWLEELLLKARIAFDLKNAVMQAARQNGTTAGFLAQIHAMELPRALYGAILERMTVC